MAEKQMEGLEAGEILDELDVEVPTAAYKCKCSNCGEESLKLEYEIIENNDTELMSCDFCCLENGLGEIQDKTRLYSQKDHREALMEAVQQAREQERRRILDNLQTNLYQLDWIKILQEAIESRPSSWGYPDRKVKTKNGFNHPVIEWRNASDELIYPIWKQLEEELEEEVEGLDR